MWRNSEISYGSISKGLHWLIAVTVFALFGLGLWMVDLDYYDSWYRQGPDLHRSVGMLLMAVMAMRALWMLWAGKPSPLSSHRRWEIVLAHVVHGLMYLLVFSIGVSGYLLSTADGHGIEVFNWFSVPSSGEWIADQEDVAGEVHEYLAFGLIAVALLHALAAIKHQLIDKDQTLKRMM